MFTGQNARPESALLLGRPTASRLEGGPGVPQAPVDISGWGADRLDDEEKPKNFAYLNIHIS